MTMLLKWASFVTLSILFIPHSHILPCLFHCSERICIVSPLHLASMSPWSRYHFTHQSPYHPVPHLKASSITDTVKKGVSDMVRWHYPPIIGLAAHPSLGSYCAGIIGVPTRWLVNIHDICSISSSTNTLPVVVSSFD